MKLRKMTLYWATKMQNYENWYKTEQNDAKLSIKDTKLSKTEQLRCETEQKDAKVIKNWTKWCKNVSKNCCKTGQQRCKVYANSKHFKKHYFSHYVTPYRSVQNPTLFSLLKSRIKRMKNEIEMSFHCFHCCCYIHQNLLNENFFIYWKHSRMSLAFWKTAREEIEINL